MTLGDAAWACVERCERASLEGTGTRWSNKSGAGRRRAAGIGILSMSPLVEVSFASDESTA